MRYLLLCLFCLPVFVFGQLGNSNSDGFVIRGNIKGLPDNTFVYLAGNTENDTIARATISNGVFTLVGKVQRPDGRLIIFPALNKRIFLFTGNEQVTITGSDPDFSDLSFVGSSTQSDYEEFINQIKPLGDFVNYYRQQTQMAQTPKARDSAAIMLNTAYTLYQTSIDRFVDRRKKSPVAALVLYYSIDNDPNKDVVLLEKRYQNLEPEAKNNNFAPIIQRMIDNGKIGAVGTKALDFTQKDTLGKDVSLAQFRGKYVLLDFWASWCGPCRKENPNVVEAYRKYKNKNFTILSVSLDQQKENWLRAIHADGLTWTHVSDLQFWGNAVAQLYHIESIPQNFLIDPDGNIIAKNLRGDALEAKLQQVLK